MRSKQARVIVVPLGVVAAAVVLLMHSAGTAAQGRTRVAGEWPVYGGDKASTKYSPLDQINAANVGQLRIAWRQSATPPPVRQGPGAPVPTNYAHTPLMVSGLLYMSTGYGTVAALDAGSGKVVWFDPPPPRSAAASDGPSIVPVAGLAQAKRGLAYWSDGKDARIITTVGRDLVALNAKMGTRYPDFGRNGVIDLTQGTRPTPR